MHCVLLPLAAPDNDAHLFDGDAPSLLILLWVPLLVLGLIWLLGGKTRPAVIALIIAAICLLIWTPWLIRTVY